MRPFVVLALLVCAWPCQGKTDDGAPISAPRPIQNSVFADVPRTDPSYDCASLWARHTGVLVGYPDGTFGGKRLMTRYEFAVVLTRIVPQLVEITRKTEPEGKGAKQTLTREEFDCLRQMIVTFRPELDLLEVDSAQLLTEIDACQRVMAPPAPPDPFFADVPRDHWAYDAVQTLAARGLMLGYPERH